MTSPPGLTGSPPSDLHHYAGDNPESVFDPDGHDGKKAAGYQTVQTGQCTMDSPCGHKKVKVKPPTQQEILLFVEMEANAYHLSGDIAWAVVLTESSGNTKQIHANKNKKGDTTSTDYGLMQINSQAFGKQYPGPGGKKFTVNGKRVRTDWKYDVFVGMAVLKQAANYALNHAPNDQTAATYARYNAGGHWADYRQKGTQVYQDVQRFLTIYAGGKP